MPFPGRASDVRHDNENMTPAPSFYYAWRPYEQEEKESWWTLGRRKTKKKQSREATQCVCGKHE